MKTIYQRNERDCGVACLAMLANVSYKKAFEFLEREYSRTFTISSGKIAAGLRHFGRRPLTERCESVSDVPKLYELDHHALLGGNVLVPDGQSGWKKCGHWAVWDGDEQCVRDPYGFDYPFETTKVMQVA